ncbi:MAG: hypothetical protein AAF597_07570, partial [Bacteroidota bacterium]
ETEVPPKQETGEKQASTWPPENVRFGDKVSDKEPWYGNTPMASDLTEEERIKVSKSLFGAWKDSTPDDLAEQIISSRTISTREINLDD